MKSSPSGIPPRYFASQLLETLQDNDYARICLYDALIEISGIRATVSRVNQLLDSVES